MKHALIVNRTSRHQIEVLVSNIITDMPEVICTNWGTFVGPNREWTNSPNARIAFIGSKEQCEKVIEKLDVCFTANK